MPDDDLISVWIDRRDKLDGLRAEDYTETVRERMREILQDRTTELPSRLVRWYEAEHEKHRKFSCEDDYYDWWGQLHDVAEDLVYGQ